MIARARAIATVLVAGLALSCMESTGIDTQGNTELRLPPGSDRDVSKVAGTYVHPQATTSRLILLPSGTFTTQYVTGETTWALGGSFVRADSSLALSFTGSSVGVFVMSGLVRADTIYLWSPAALTEQIPLLHFSFVRVRDP